MFESVDRLDYTLRDRDGRPVDVRAYLPKSAWLVDYGELTEIVRFVCERERDRAPFTFEEHERAVHAVIGPDDCRVHKMHERR